MDDFDAASEAGIKVAFATATGKDLGLDDQIISTDFLGDGFGLRGALGHTASGHLDAVLVQESHGQVLVDRQTPGLRCHSNRGALASCDIP